MDNMPKFKYQDLVQAILAKIKDGTFPYNSKLPSEAEFCSEFSVSRQTVRNALKQLANDGYIYSVKGSGSFVNMSARPRKKKIGVMFTTVAGYICSDILNGLENVFTKNGYSIQLELSHDRCDFETRFLQKMCNSNVSGIIIEASKSNFPTPNAALFRQLDELRIPYVFVNGYYRNVPCNAVVWEDENVAYQMTTRLIKAGHRKIGCIFRFDEMQGAHRYLGYTRALIENDIEINNDIICWYHDTIENSCVKPLQTVLIEKFIDQLSDNCTALVCYNDLIAGIVINRLQMNNIKIPEQISIVSFDNSDLVKLFSLKGFYSFEHPKNEIGHVAAKRLLHLIKHPDDNERQILMVKSPQSGLED